MELNYCVQCGKRLTMRAVGDEGEQKYCTGCNKYFFDNPACCVLVGVINEHKQILLLRQETGQRVTDCKYVRSYYFEPKNIIMSGFIAYVKENAFGISNEVDALQWVEINKARTLVERENNFSGVHLDYIAEVLIRN